MASHSHTGRRIFDLRIQLAVVDAAAPL